MRTDRLLEGRRGPPPAHENADERDSVAGGCQRTLDFADCSLGGPALPPQTLLEGHLWVGWTWHSLEPFESAGNVVRLFGRPIIGVGDLEPVGAQHAQP